MENELEDMGKENNELKEKAARISADLIQIESFAKDLTHQIECIKDSSQKLVGENENIM